MMVSTRTVVMGLIVRRGISAVVVIVQGVFVGGGRGHVDELVAGGRVVFVILGEG